MVRNEILSLFLHNLRNGLERNSEHFYLPWNGLERSYEVPSVFLFCKMIRNGIPNFFFLPRNGSKLNSEFLYLLRNGSEQNSEHFPFRGTDRILTECIKISVSSVFRRIFFLSRKMATLVWTARSNSSCAHNIFCCIRLRICSQWGWSSTSSRASTIPKRCWQVKMYAFVVEVH